MKELRAKEIERVNGGIIPILAVAAAYVGGYVYGKLTKEEKPAPPPCNPATNPNCA